VNTVAHVALRTDWEAALVEGIYDISTRSLTRAQVGFIHAAHAHQLDGVIERFYADLDEVLVLIIDVTAAMIPVIEELPLDAEGRPIGNEAFPHLYGPIPVSAVIAIRTVHPQRPARPHHPSVPGAPLNGPIT